MSYGSSISLDIPFSEAVTRVRAALVGWGSACSPRST